MFLVAITRAPPSPANLFLSDNGMVTGFIYAPDTRC
jgi:hypothetical protein